MNRRLVTRTAFWAALLATGALVSTASAGWHSWGGSRGGGSSGGWGSGGSSGYTASYASGGWGSSGGYGGSSGGYAGSSGGYGGSSGGYAGSSGGYASGGGSHGGFLGRIKAHWRSHHSSHGSFGSGSGGSSGYASGGSHGGWGHGHGSSGGYASGGSSGGYVGGSSGGYVSGGSSGGYISGYASSSPVEYSSPAYEGSVIEGSVTQPATETPAAGGDHTAQNARSVMLTVSVPEDAKVYVNGLETKSTGALRRYVSRGLDAGSKYTYEVRAEVTRDGEPVVETKTVDVSAGQSSSVAFDLRPSKAETKLTLRVPEDARVYLANRETTTGGAVRTFRTSILSEGKVWSNYTVRVSVERNGQTLTKEETIALTGGEARELSFDFDAPKVASAR